MNRREIRVFSYLTAWQRLLLHLLVAFPSSWLHKQTSPP
jgi:hypothetical protein